MNENNKPNEHFSLRDELASMRTKIEKVSEDILKLTIINEHQYNERQANSLKLEKLDDEFTQAKGAITLLKGIIGVFAGSAIAFCTWIVSSYNDVHRDLANTNQHIAVVETIVQKNEHDIVKLSEENAGEGKH